MISSLASNHFEGAGHRTGFVDSFHASGERFIYKKDESTLCKNINFDTLRTWIDETASTLGRPISEKDKKHREEEHAMWLTLPPKY